MSSLANNATRPHPAALRFRRVPRGARRAAALALGLLGDRRSLSGLLTALHDSDEDARAFAALGLGFMSLDAAVEPLLEALQNDPAEWVRAYSAESLGRLAAEKALPLLRQTIASDSSQTVVRKAHEALAIARPSFRTIARRYARLSNPLWNRTF